MQPLVIGIAGGTASGKTTLAQGLVATLGSRCLRLMHDRYYRNVPAGQSGATGYNFDHPASLDTPRLVEDLALLRAGRIALVPRYDFATHTRLPEPEPLEPNEVIVVEGILVLQDPQLRSLMDLRVFVEAPDDLRLIRRIRRDLDERGRTLDSVLWQWQQTVAPMHDQYVRPCRGHAELVLDGTWVPEAMLQALMTVVDARLGSR